MNIISFSLYGSVPKYCIGAIKNTDLAAQFYPDWTCLFFVTPSVPSDIVKAILERRNTRIFTMPDYDPSNPVSMENVPGMFMRMLPMDDMPFTWERIIVRDADSRICQREVEAVREWVESGKILHVMRDHFAHGREMNGGLWGLRKSLAHIPAQVMFDWCNSKGRPIDYGDDQDFLGAVVWPRFNHSVTQHDSFSRRLFPEALPFPTKRIHPRFCGEVWDENDIPREHDWIQIPKEQ